MRITSNIESGVPPLEITFTVGYSYTNINSMIVQAEMDTDELGNTYTGSIAIVVYDRDTMDALLQAKWNGMKQALFDGDIEGALEYFHEKFRAKYGEIFTRANFSFAC
ncbi:MAG: hypothetical protein ABIF87_13435 [Pseudomonadota bacterium]